MPRVRTAAYKEVGRRLRRARLDAGYPSIPSLVSSLHEAYPSLSAKQLGDWERGTRAPDPLALCHIASKCGVTVEALLCGNVFALTEPSARDVNRGKLIEEVMRLDDNSPEALNRLLAVLEETVVISRTQAEANRAQAEANRDQALANRHTAQAAEHAALAAERMSRALPPQP